MGRNLNFKDLSGLREAVLCWESRRGTGPGSLGLGWVLQVPRAQRPEGVAVRGTEGKGQMGELQGCLRQARYTGQHCVSPTPSLRPPHGCLSPHPLPTGPIIFILLGEKGSPCPHKGPSVGPLSSFLGHFSFSPLPAHPTPQVFPSALSLGSTTHPSSSSSAPPCSHLSWRPG